MSEDMNPSLNDILKPLLEERGWKSITTTYNSKRVDVWTAPGDGNKAVLISVGIILQQTTSTSINPADPEFFAKLEEWLK